MAVSIRMPQLGESVVEGTIGRWLKQPGDWVEKDEPIAEIITDKVNAELPSPVAGRVEALLVAEGATVPAGQEIARVAEADSAPPAPASPPAEGGVAPVEPPSRAPAGRRIRSSPLVRRLAEEHQIDLTQVRGTGLGGRITKDDILKYLAERERAAPVEKPPAIVREPAAAVPPPPTAAAAPPPVLPSTPLAAGEERLPLSPMRRTIAEHLTRTHQTVPAAWTMVEVDVTALVRWREQVREEFRRREGVELTYLAPFVQVVVEALKEFPLLNARWEDEHIVLRRNIHLGIAVALEDGLIVPVLHHAEERNLVGIARALADLIARARAGTLTLSDVQGATFTVNNTGAFGSIVSVPIIPQGQSGIVTMEAIVKRPVVVDDAIAIRSLMNVCLSFDHRVVDGAVAGRFLQSIKRRLEGFQPPF
jgi:2-oxoisovalerate dehydrogenase E2 component (dihydrolipoyl transacylase)